MRPLSGSAGLFLRTGTGNLRHPAAPVPVRVRGSERRDMDACKWAPTTSLLVTHKRQGHHRLPDVEEEADTGSECRLQIRTHWLGRQGTKGPAVTECGVSRRWKTRDRLSPEPPGEKAAPQTPPGQPVLTPDLPDPEITHPRGCEPPRWCALVTAKRGISGAWGPTLRGLRTPSSF